jgi:hypothetical protein
MNIYMQLCLHMQCATKGNIKISGGATAGPTWALACPGFGRFFFISCWASLKILKI